MREKDLQKVIDALPYLHEILPEDHSFYVYDVVNMTTMIVEEKNLKTVGLAKQTVGAKVDAAQVELYSAIKKSKKPVSFVVPKGYFDVPVKTLTSPIFNDNGEVIAVISVMKNMDKEVKIEETSSNVYNSVSELSVGIEEIASTSQQLSTFIKGMADFSSDTQERILEIDEILQVMKNVASQSKLLALNASIESARAGEAGKGFSVVAKEMGNLAILSKDSAEQVNNSLNSMRNAINTIAAQIEETSTNTETQAAATEEIAATSQDILEVIQQLADISRVFSLEEALNK